MGCLFDAVEISQGLWQARTAHQSIQEYEFKDYIFALDMKYTFMPDNEDNCKISDEGMNKTPAEFFLMTVFVKTVNRKTYQNQMRQTAKTSEK